MEVAQAPVKIPKGSIQYWPIKVFDAFNTLTTLTGADLRFDLFRVDGDTDVPIITNASASNTGMTALPLINSTTLNEGLYKVFITFVASPQQPRLGPYWFIIDD